MNKSLAAICPSAQGSYATKNPEEYAQNFFERRGFGLPVQVQCVEHEAQALLKTWYVRPQDWLSHLMESSPNLLAGDGDASQNFNDFWRCFRMAHSHHDVFNSPLAGFLDKTVPLVLHGDEGRTLKRGKCMVMSVQSILGHVQKPVERATCTCREELAANPRIPPIGVQGDEDDAYSLPRSCRRSLKKQLTNYRGHSYLSRWLLFSLPSWVYVKHPEVLDALVERLAGDLRALFHEGFAVGTQRFFAAVVFVKGDMAWHRQIYNLTRSYAFCGTVATGKICHLCLAGGPAGPMAEDYSEVPGWANTLLLHRPWTTPPALAAIPGYPCPEELLQPDPFHLIKFGIGRSIAGGVLTHLARKGFFDFEGSESRAFAERLNRASPWPLFFVVPGTQAAPRFEILFQAIPEHEKLSVRAMEQHERVGHGAASSLAEFLHQLGLAGSAPGHRHRAAPKNAAAL